MALASRTYFVQHYLLVAHSRCGSLRFSNVKMDSPTNRCVQCNATVNLFGFAKKQSPKMEIVQAGDPVLHEPATKVEQSQVNSDSIQKIIDDMIQAMRREPGVGLAAPQIGVPLQIIVLEDTEEYINYVSREEADAQQRKPFDLLVIINPKLKTEGTTTAKFFEGCFSVNGYRGLVERHLEVEVTGLDRRGDPLRIEASGWKARILQHECDHLDGTLYVDKLIPKTFRTSKNLQLPLARGVPQPGICKTRK